ncbi:MAG TPA: PCRF domain-containing protein, partial [Chthoniobacterales bacterium]
MDFAPLVEQKRRRFQELETEIATPSLFENPKRAREVMREHSQIKRLLDDWAALKKSEKELEENRELSASSDSDLAELAASEIPVLEKRAEELARTVQFALLPPEPHEDRDAIMEIRAGAGGNEAALFAADLYRMYCRFAEARGYKVEQLESSPSELGGLKEVIF